MHWVRYVILGEDKSSVRKGTAPETLAMLRNLVLNLLRLIGYTSIKAGSDAFSAPPLMALRALGVNIGLAALPRSRPIGQLGRSVV